jgi:hypothetical protein
MLDRLVGQPTSSSSVDRRAGMAGLRERAREWKKEDDRWGQDVSERERARERGWARLLGHARCWAARARACGPAVRLGRAREKEEKRPGRQFLFFFFKNVNSKSICLFH